MRSKKRESIKRGICCTHFIAASLPITDPACAPLLSLSVHGCSGVRDLPVLPRLRSISYLPSFLLSSIPLCRMAGTEGGSPGFFATVRFAVLDKVEATIAIDQTTAIAFLIAFPLLTMVRSVGREDGRQASPSAVRRGTNHTRS